MSRALSDSELAFAARALRRQRLFLALSAAGLAVAVLLGGYYAWRRWHDPAFPIGARLALIVLILLNSRQNLRQYRYSQILEKLVDKTPPAGAS
ncbi:MAG TPA: hypothetical protein VJS92_13030 [Candidatus Polarisedimenticolaceae bacterium]|nr:hypothetical protein [Candidatus Polarisedimenticolaceae bacterium]